MTALLQTKAFHKIPPANIQAVFMRLQRIDYRAGEVIIKQGDVGDYFYVVVKGSLHRDARDAAQQGRGQARGTQDGRHLR